MLAFPDPMTEIHIRRAVRSDCSGILDIYNDAVLKTTATYDYEPRPLEHRLAWFEDHQRTGHAIFVAEAGDGRIVGWSALNRYHDRMGFRFTAENSIYVAEESRGQGLGARLLEPLASRFRRGGGIGMFFIVGVGLGWGYFIVEGIAQTMGELGFVPPWMSIWVPVAALAALTTSLTLKADTL